MAKNWWDQLVYPPRYFCGFVDTPRNRIQTIDAPLIPLNAHCVAVFAAQREGCFYSEHIVSRKVRLKAIQYAISVLDPRRGVVRVEKFNHPFESTTWLGPVDGLTCIYTDDRRPLYAEYPLSEVMDRMSHVRRNVLQFIS